MGPCPRHWVAHLGLETWVLTPEAMVASDTPGPS